MTDIRSHLDGDKSRTGAARVGSKPTMKHGRREGSAKKVQFLPTEPVYNVFMDDDSEWPMSRWCKPRYISWEVWE